MAELEPEVRQANLAFALLGSPRRRETAWVGQHVDGYQHRSQEALNLQIRRDVAALRLAGVPVRYRDGQLSLDRERYELAPVDLTEEEASVVGLAVDLSQRGSLGAFARSGWTKLAASGATRTFDSAPLASAAHDATQLDPDAFHQLLGAIRHNLRAHFDFHVPGSGRVQRRTVDPWSIVSLNTRAYLVGWDVDRDAERVFRATRISDVTLVRDTTDFHSPTGDPGEIVRELLRGPVTDARITVGAGTAEELAAKGAREPGSTGETDTIVLGEVERDWVVRTTAAHALDVRAIEPEDIRRDVLALLTQAGGGDHGE
ncbi:YafY family protein [Corynebacterium sp. HMSC074A01]|uniref:helix-turn-helix transcriptional regulator n=1 Tax=Corynebacterium sp. HMSC074A01 TaxID=1715030 RepID=UPI0008A15697|nr:WYL domain-containing protein [Corynebacterium sp. HMSC074A01]OHF39478.1 hypothetical protein HMPREF2550_01965 [Corynebacterium sp. HMSC074A01]